MTNQTLKLNQITTVADNPRKSFDEQSIEGLAQSILTDGLLQNLVVAKPSGKKKKHTLICGERRFRALSLLQKRGDIEKDYAVKVEIKEGLSEDEILRMATVENVQREDLAPLEEANALSTLIHDGEKLEDITAQTGLSVATIRRRLMLLNLSEESQTALSAGEVSLSQAESMALGSFEDQERAMRQIANGWNDSPESIKDTIIGRKPSLDLAIFDKELYTGGFITDLLGEDENTFFADREQFDTLQRAAIESLMAEHEETADFVEFEEGYFSRYTFKDTPEGEKGGVVIVLSSSGEVEVHEGLIRPEIDESNVAALQAKKKAIYGRPLIKYMAVHKSAAVQSALLENPRTAKELIVAQKLSSFKNHACLSYFEQEEGITIPAAVYLINAKARDILALFQDVSEDMGWRDLGYLFARDVESAYVAVRALSDEQIEEVLVSLNALEFGQMFLEQHDTYDQGIFNLIANDLNVDMRNYWRPDEAFFKRRNMDQLQSIIKDAGCSKNFGNGTGYKKKELVSSMAKHFVAAPQIEAPNEDELKTVFWLPEAMQFPAIDPDRVQAEPVQDSDEADFEDEAYAIAAE